MLVNGRTVVFTPLYEVMTDAAGYAAFVDDPQYRIDYTMAGPLVLEAWGEVKPLAETLGMLSGKVTGMAAVCEDLRIRRQKLEEDVSQLQVLYQREAEAHERLAEAHGRLARQNLELTDQNAALSLELTEMRGSTSWRITRPLRKIKRCLERK